MALCLTGTTAALSGATQNLNTILSTAIHTDFVASIMIQHATGSTGTVYFGGSALTTTNAWGEMPSGAAMTYNAPAGSYLDTKTVYLVGTTNDVVRIAALA